MGYYSLPGRDFSCLFTYFTNAHPGRRVAPRVRAYYASLTIRQLLDVNVVAVPDAIVRREIWKKWNGSDTSFASNPEE
jgi:hypothetical protein